MKKNQVRSGIKNALAIVLALSILISIMPMAFAQENLGQSEKRAENSEGIQTDYSPKIDEVEEVTKEEVMDESPVLEVRAEEIMLIENTSGYNRFDAGSAWFCYSDYGTNLVIRLKDGTELRNEGSSVEYQGNVYQINYSDDQSWENPWGVGSHQVTGSVLGYEFDVPVTIYAKADTPLEYEMSYNKLTVTGFGKAEGDVVIPEEIGGFPVYGLDIFAVGTIRKVTSIIIPDAVQKVDLFVPHTSIERIEIGAGAESININAQACDQFREIVVSENNQNYATVDGVLYDKSVSTLLCYPAARGSDYAVPDTVVDLDGLLSDPSCFYVNPVISPQSVGFVQNGAAIYNKEMTKLLRFDRTKAGAVVIPDYVQELEDGAFAYCEQVTAVEIPKSVTNIAYASFMNCSALTTVTLPESVVEIGSFAFAECTSLPSVALPNGLETIENNAFQDCMSLFEVQFPDSLTSIGFYAFSGSGLKTIQFGEGLTRIRDSAFANTDLVEIVIPDSVAYLGNYVFDSCSSLAKVVLPSGLKSIPEGLFWSCEKLKRVVLPDGVTSISWMAFAYSGIVEMTVPHSVTSIGLNAFSHCTNLKKIVLPESLTWIDSSSFANCGALTIYGYQDSYAQQYAETNGIPFNVVQNLTAGNGVSAIISQDNFEEEVTLVSKVVEDAAGQPDITYPDSVVVEDSLVVDISFRNQNGEEVQPNGEVTVSIPVPENMDGEMCTVYHVLDDNTVEEMDAVYSNGYMVFTTDRFSYYVLAQLEAVGTTVSGRIAGNLTDVTVELYDQDGNLVGSVTGAGTYILEGVLAGTYTLKVSKTNYATREYQVTVGESAVDLDVAINLVGDINSDGKINTMDVSQINGFVKQMLVLTEYQQACANVNGDTSINTMDVSLVNAHVKGIKDIW